jgi:hypothetical protein
MRINSAGHALTEISVQIFGHAAAEKSYDK